MKLLNLPSSTIINRAIPKNSFDSYTNTKQKKRFVELVDKIRWSNKLSSETINLKGKDINEIQVFEISLRQKDELTDLLEVIDRAIPYNIIFVLNYGDLYFLSTSQKHLNPLNENTTVIDWRFSSGWISAETSHQLNLKQSLDFVFTDFCKQLSGRHSDNISLIELVEKEKKIKELERAIILLQSSIKKTRQFNKKVELNLELKGKIEELNIIH